MATTSGVRSRRRRILLAEDNRDERQMYASRMREAGWDVDEIESGAGALEAAVAGMPDVVITDLTMPGVDGAEATRLLKTDSRTRHIPVVVLSGFPERSYEAYRAGCHTFLSKPCLVETLLEIMDAMGREEAPSSPSPTGGG